MKSFLISTFLFLTVSTFTLAAPNPIPEPEAEPSPHFEADPLSKRNFTGQPGIIGPFSLITHSSDKLYDKLVLNGRHIGAGTNLAVAGPGTPFCNSTYDVFYLNTTKGDSGPCSGTIVYPFYPQAPIGAGIVSNATGDVAQLWFYPTEVWSFSFDHEGRFGYKKAYDKWLLCDDLLTPYGPLTGIAFWTGQGSPKNKLCKRIEIKKTCCVN